MDGLPSHIPSMPQTRGLVYAHKAYASENDAASLHHGSRQPQTPNKPSPVAGSPRPGSSKQQYHHHQQQQQQQTGKSSNKKKARVRNTPTSPDSMQRQTPPHGPLYLKPAATRAAFAGATFHASPAPSALPIPSFVTRSSSDSPLVVHGGAGEDAIQEPSPPATDTDAPTPLRASSAPRSRESPLDFMFRAHREEKERSGKLSRATSSSSHVATTGAIGTQPHSQAGARSSPNLLTTSSQVDRHVSRTSPFTGPEPSEVHGLPMGPAFSTPYQERMKAARSDYARRPPPQARRIPDAPSNDATPPEDPTEALKKFLFGTPAPTSKNQPPPLATPTTANAHRPQLRKAETLPPEPSRSNDIQAMENDLRRILKLDLNKNNSSSSNHHNDQPPR
ncbi:hypothetical protein CP532_1310 [Ophiocordyceps camponoti-leonardi (nom. inval.)]|nr:hypothetical protein CP532_1310 [Ophiocordyceps camponoti-leonardi (nom. inval.)]